MDDALTLLGLMKKAGKLAIGADNAFDAAARGKAKLLITASDASPRVQRQTARAGGETGTPYISLVYTKGALGAALGQNECAAAAITDKGFSESFRKKLGLPEDKAKNSAKPQGGRSKGGNS
ncbi:MAG: ribosomal L7Ae/L30e/S12e/Gadd45 family protein [Clostridia bacterium]|nr:ribosomal L7Ae/L30e/S12e/Gadd45 family protein [Clostridia bacterium]